MNKEMKRSFRIFILKILAVVFVLCICYFLYAFVYRAKTELPTKAVVTNRGAAVYTPVSYTHLDVYKRQQ